MIFSESLNLGKRYSFQSKRFCLPISVFRQHWLPVCFVILLLLGELTPTDAETYRLIDNRYLEIGNQWEYQVHITLENNVPVDKWETSSETVTGTKDVSGHLTKILRTIDSDGTGYEYYDLSSDYLLDYGYDDDGFHVIFINNNPTEVAPVWVNSTDNNRLMGTGDFQIQMGAETWTGSISSYITYINQQVITVPAGTFSCIVVSIRAVYSDTLGFQGELTETDYIDPEVGVIKRENSDGMYNPNDGQTYYSEYTGSLTWTNIKPSIAKDITNYDFAEDETTTNFDIWNDSLGTLNYQVSIDQGQDYFSVFPDSGSSTDASDKQTHTITVNYDNIPYNQAVTGRVKIESSWADDSPQFINLSAQGTLPFPDLNDDSKIFFEDLEILTFNWLDNTCNEPNWCQGCDIDYSGTVDLFDFTVLAEFWRDDISLIGHWKFDDNAPNTVVTDSSGENNHGVAQQNTCDLTTAGMRDGAFTFNGSSDYIAVPDNPDWTFDSDFTITLWVKYDTFNSNWWESAFVGHDEGGGEQNKWIFSYDPTSQKTLFHITIPNTNSVFIQGNSWTAQTGQWYFISMTRSGNTYTFYNNGDTNGSQIDTTQIPDAATPLTIGWAEGGSTFDGAIDDVRIYNKALLAIEIAELYNPVSTPDTNSPTPDPMTWSTLPYATGTTSIAMVATTASDISGVEYYFTCTAGGGHDSGWQDSPSYEDTGLDPNTQYTYTVKARDKSSNQNPTTPSTEQSATTSAPSGTELLGHWKLDDNADNTLVVDSSGQNNHGTAQQNTSVLHTTGVIGGAFTFNGTGDYISVPDNPDWTFAGDFTITLWVKFDSFNSNWWESAFVGHDESGGTANKWILSYDPTNTNTLFHIYNPDLGSVTFVEGDSWTAETGQWYFISMTRSGNTYTFYKDGISNGSQSDTTVIPDAAAPLTIGWAEGASTFDGAIDDVRIYNRALSETEIADLHSE